VGYDVKIDTPQGMIVRPSRVLDSDRDYLTDDLTPDGLAALIKSVDSGEVGDFLQLAEEIESKDPHIQAVAAVRRHAVTALEWHLDADMTDESRQADAQEAADYCESQLRSLRTWEGALRHQATAFGSGMAVIEKVWYRGELVEVVEVPSNRLIGDRTGGPGVFILTDQDQSIGVHAIRSKFAIWTPHLRAGDPFIVAPMRAASRLYLISRYASTDWALFCEKFGIPFVAAWADHSINENDLNSVYTMLRSLMADSTAMFNKTEDKRQVDLEFFDVAKQEGPHAAIIDWCERKQSIAFLGQTLTTEMQDVGARAAAQVHQNVRAGIIRSDLKYEADAVRDQVLSDMVRYRWPGEDRPVPYFVRETPEIADVDAERLMLDKLAMAQTLGLKIPADWAYEALGIPMPTPEADNAPSGPA